MDKVKRKEKKRDIKKRWFLAAAVIVAAVVLGLLLHEKNAPEPVQSPEEIEKEIINQQKETYIVRLAENEITALSVVPRDYTPYALEKGGEGMQLNSKPDVPLRQNVVEDILYAAGMLQANITLGTAAELQDEMPHFGFENPSLRYEITDAQGRKTEVLLGDLVPETEMEAEQYFCLAGGMVYTVHAESVDVLFHHAEYLRDFKQPQLQADLIDRIDATGQLNLSLQYTADGFVMEKPIRYPVDEEKMDVLLNYLERMAFEAYLGTPEENDLEELGLKSPAICVTFTQAPSVVNGITAEGETVSLEVGKQTYTLHIGAETGKSGVYVAWNGGIYKGSNFLFGFWKTMKPEELYSKTPMHFQVERLQAVLVEQDGEETLYELEMVEVITDNNRIATDEYGQILYDVQVKKNGEGMDAAVFLDWYVQLNRLPMFGKVADGQTKEGKEMMRLTFKTEALERNIVFRPYDALHAVMEVEGNGVYYVENTALSLLENLP